MKHSIQWLAIAAFLPASAAAQPSASADRQSRYTSLDACEVIATAPEEAGYSRSACPGLGGYSLEFVVADGRENLVVMSPGGAQQSLGLPSLMGGGFSALGRTIEWRGEKANRLSPDALIVRYNAVEDPLRPGQPTSYLLVVSLSAPPCLAARVPPARAQNELARIAADGAMTCM